MADRFHYARWLFLAAFLCAILCYLGLFVGADYLHSHGHAPATGIAGGFLFGLCAPVFLVWALKVIIWGNRDTRRRANLPPMEDAWWEKRD